MQLLAPDRECAQCQRLAAFRAENRRSMPSAHNAPVPSFGRIDATLLIVGLAPGLKGANRTGRPFTGDHAGRMLYDTLARFGFARGPYGGEADDGMVLDQCRITNAVRCVPPANRPIAAEITACRSFLAAELSVMPGLRAVLALGTVAHASVITALGYRPADFGFAHGAEHELPGCPTVVDSYHCSRQNTNTGRLTQAMFDDVFAGIRRRLEGT